jgi:hypothetical protein
MEAFGFLGLVMVLVGGLWAILTFCIPFMIFSLLGKVDKLIKLQTEANWANRKRTDGN